MNNKKEITTHKDQKHINRNILIFFIIFLLIGIYLIIIGFSSIKILKDQATPLFIILALAIYILQWKRKVIDSYAKNKNITGGKLYYEWMRTSSANWIILVIFIVVVVIVAVIRYDFWVIF